MSLLGAVAYDPAVETEASTSGRAVMTAFDTTNLRITFTVPASGTVRVRITCTGHGAASYAQNLLGVVQGSTVMGRVAQSGRPSGQAAATTMQGLSADFIVKGLTPGASLTWDAAWSTKVVFGFSALKRGGPNDTTVDNAFGAVVFMIIAVT